MEHAKKMLLIEPSVLEKLNHQNNDDNPTSRLDGEMETILKSNMDDRKKCILYLQILQRYLHFNEENRRPIELPIIAKNDKNMETNINDGIDSKDSVSTSLSTLKEEKCELKPTLQIDPLYSTNHILSHIPKTYIKRGESLLHLISLSKNKIRWNDNGTLVIDNKCISGSNIIDLINDLLRPLKKENPIGWEHLAKALNDIKIPLTYLGNPKRVEYINNLKLKHLGNISPDEEYFTPQNKRILKKIHKKLDWEKWTPY